jgi:pullulanase
MKNRGCCFLIMINSVLFSASSILPNGVYIFDGETTFSLRAPGSYRVEMVLFESYFDDDGNPFEMIRDGKGNFSLKISKDLSGKYYGYRLFNYDKNTQSFPESTIIADPYSMAVATQNKFNPVAKTLIISEDFDWGNDTWVNYHPRDMVIYESHLKDLSAHSTSGSSAPGTYLGFLDTNQKGGINHLLDMGYNAVEFLPLFDFGNVELPFKDSTTYVMNTWNPYERNHWGYMTTHFFAPESQYASNGTTESGGWNGVGGAQVHEFKTMVKKLHDSGISVILDVVYNHVSQYDHHPLKQIEKNKYFRTNDNGDYTSISGCGNDLKTEDEDMRMFILNSVKFWMTEYHIDGFRFDLALLIDWQTLEMIRDEARKINPNVFITAEPWGGGYDPNRFSDRDWSSWNDQFRNGVKGQNPHDGLGFIFGEWQGELHRDPFLRFIQGSPRERGGQYISVNHSVNYLESHDDYTLGDFIRIGLQKNDPEDVIVDIDKHAQMTAEELKIHKLAAFMLLTSQGTVMMAQGQEWGRSKVIAPTNMPDPNIGRMDHNSYEKDNETNWLNWDHKEMNSSLVDYYRDLIKLRKEHPALRRANLDDIEFDLPKNKQSFGYYIHPDKEDALFVCVNGNRVKNAKFIVPEGNWRILFAPDSPELNRSYQENDRFELTPSTGIILKRKES